MNKKLLSYLSVAGSLLLVTATTSTANGFNIGSLAISKNDSSIVWMHYNGVEQTDSSFGYREYWTNCTNHEVSFTKPDGGGYSKKVILLKRTF